MNLEKGGKRMIDLEKRAKAWDEFSGEAREFTIGDTFNSAYELGVRDGAASVPRWTRVEDGLPERRPNVAYSCVRCLVTRKGFVSILCFNHEQEVWDDEECDDYECGIYEVEAWMPLPQPYTEDTSEQTVRRD